MPDMVMCAAFPFLCLWSSPAEASTVLWLLSRSRTASIFCTFYLFFSFCASPACCEFQKCNISLQMSHSTPQKHPSSRKGIPVRISCFHFRLVCCSVVTRREPPLPYFLIVLTRQCFSDYFGAEMFSVCALEDLDVSAEACIATGLSAGEQEA